MFPDTRWTLIAAATLNGDATGRRALEALCQAYWPAVVAFLESRGQSHEEAEDIAQEFFAALVESKLWQRADQARGRFRSFLLGALMRVAGHHARRAEAVKRGAKATLIALDELAEDGVELAAPDANTQMNFDRAWADRVLERAMEALMDETPDEREFLLLQRFLVLGDEAPEYAGAAQELGCSLGAFKSRVRRFRQRFRDLVEREVACTVSEPHEVAGEMQHLEDILSHPGYARP